jgi:hypothetical protein
MTRFLFSVWRLRGSWCGAGCPSLTSGWVCNLLVQLLLGLARAVTLVSKSRRTHDHILLSHLRLSQLGGPGPRIYIPQEQGGPVIPLGTGFHFVDSSDSQGYGGGILTLLHTGNELYSSQSQSHIATDGRSVSRYVLVSSPNLGHLTRDFFYFDRATEYIYI